MNKNPQAFYEKSTSPTEQIKRDIIQLAKETTDHYAKSYHNDREKFAFHVKAKVLALRLQTYTPEEGRVWLRKELVERDKKIKEVKSKDLDKNTKENTIMNIRFTYAESIYEQCLLVLHNSPIVEAVTEGIIDMGKDEKLVERIRSGQGGYRSGEKVESIRLEDEKTEDDSVESITDLSKS